MTIFKNKKPDPTMPMKIESPVTIGTDSTGTPAILPTIRPTSSSPAVLPIPGPSMTSSNDESLSSMYDRLYQPEHRYSDMMDKEIAAMPVRNHPGVLRRIAAGATGAFLGPYARDVVNYGNYNQNMVDWENKLSPIMEAANTERLNNSNMRMVANNIVSSEAQARRIQNTADRNADLADAATRRADQRDIEISNARQKIEDQRVYNEGRMAISRLLLNGGQVIHDERTGQAYVITKDGRQVPIDAKYLTEEEKIQGRIRVATAGANARAAATKANRNRVVQATITDPSDPNKTITGSLDLDSNEFTPATMKTPTGEKTTVSKARTSADVGKGLAEKAEQVKNQHPEWAPYIHIDKQGVVTIDRKTYGGLFGPSDEVNAAINKAIYGDKAPLAANVENKTPTAKTGPITYNGKQYERKNGMTLVVNPQGQVGHIPTNQVSQIPQGWKVIE